MTAVAEALARIEGRLVGLDVLQAQLASLEQKVEALVAPPRAFKPKEAGKLLGCSASTVKDMMASGKLRGVPISGRLHVPISELVRLTTVTAHAARAAPGPKLPSTKATADSIRALAKAIRKR